MSNQTSLGFIKPEVSDNVLQTIARLADNFQLADDLLVAAATDSGWQQMSATGGGTIKYRKKGGIVYVTFSNIAVSASSWLTIGTLPAGYRPAFDTRASISYNAAGTANGEVYIESDGVIKSYGSNASPYWHGSMSYPV